MQSCGIHCRRRRLLSSACVWPTRTAVRPRRSSCNTTSSSAPRTTTARSSSVRISVCYRQFLLRLAELTVKFIFVLFFCHSLFLLCTTFLRSGTFVPKGPPAPPSAADELCEAEDASADMDAVLDNAYFGKDKGKDHHADDASKSKTPRGGGQGSFCAVCA